MNSGIEVMHTVRLYCRINLDRLRRLGRQMGTFKGGLHLNIQSKMQIPTICTACGSYVDGKVKDSFMEYSSMLSDASDPKLSIVIR